MWGILIFSGNWGSKNEFFFVQKVHHAVYEFLYVTSTNYHLIIFHATYEMTEIWYVMVYGMEFRVMACTRKKVPLIIIHLIWFFKWSPLSPKAKEGKEWYKNVIFRKFSPQRHRDSPVSPHPLSCHLPLLGLSWFLLLVSCTIFFYPNGKGCCVYFSYVPFRKYFYSSWNNHV